MKKTFYLPINIPALLVSAFLAVFLVVLAQIALAHGGDLTKIHACVRNTFPNTPNIRIVDANTNCNSNETALDWPKQPGNSGLAFTCPRCYFIEDVGDRFAGKDLSGSYLNSAIFSSINFSNTNFSGAILNLAGFTSVNLNNANFTGARMHQASIGGNTSASGTNFTDVDFTAGTLQVSGNGTILSGANLANTGLNGAILTNSVAIGANFTSVDIRNANLTGSNLSGITAPQASFQSANLTNVNFTNANLSGAYFLESANLTGVTWSNTTCPDGTNSNNNSGTCQGHLNP
jgi:uncharacterized protein YjbI with pentapeptide repeats